MSDYKGEDRLRDATAFAESRFGQHYLKRLNSARKRALTDATDLNLADGYRLQRGAQAAAIEKELDYFRLASLAIREPSKLEKMLRRKPKEVEPDVDL